MISIELNDWSRSTNANESVTTAYGDPFPASWARLAYTEYDRARYIKLPGTTVPRPIFTYYTRNAQFSNNTLSTTPTLLAPSGLKMNDRDAVAGGLVQFDGTAPVKLSWAGQTTARMYGLSISRVYANGTSSRTQLVAGFETTDNSFLVPADVFGGEGYFVFSVTAYATPNDYAAGQLIPNGAPNQIVSTTSNLLRLSSTCGNGSVDTGEDCDGSGETASCDVDCTPAACGDGLRNTAAGEACDTVRDTPACDSDCTVPMCGDGHVNVELEDCDDGNTVDDGNGCSANCKFDNVCGNGTVQQPEECDSGGTDSATCDSDCTERQCGDGHVNAAAGEQCDDGNGIDTDGCDSNCHIVP